MQICNHAHRSLVYRIAVLTWGVKGLTFYVIVIEPNSVIFDVITSSHLPTESCIMFLFFRHVWLRLINSLQGCTARRGPDFVTTHHLTYHRRRGPTSVRLFLNKNTKKRLSYFRRDARSWNAFDFRRYRGNFRARIGSGTSSCIRSPLRAGFCSLGTDGGQLFFFFFFPAELGRDHPHSSHAFGRARGRASSSGLYIFGGLVCFKDHPIIGVMMTNSILIPRYIQKKKKNSEWQ